MYREELTQPLRAYLLFLPSLLFGALGLVWLWFRPFPYTAQLGLGGQLGLAAALTAGLLGGAWALYRTLASFRYASKLIERALRPVSLTLPLILLLAAGSALAEELFFRGALLPLLGVWGQALVFGLLHPATRRGWSYTAFTFVAGLVFGYATLYSGSLWPAILAHFVVNAHGFNDARLKRTKRLDT